MTAMMPGLLKVPTGKDFISVNVTYRNLYCLENHIKGFISVHKSENNVQSHRAIYTVPSYLKGSCFLQRTVLCS